MWLLILTGSLVWQNTCPCLVLFIYVNVTGSCLRAEKFAQINNLHMLLSEFSQKFSILFVSFCKIVFIWLLKKGNLCKSLQITITFCLNAISVILGSQILAILWTNGSIYITFLGSNYIFLLSSGGCVNWPLHDSPALSHSYTLGNQDQCLLRAYFTIIYCVHALFRTTVQMRV